MGKIFDALEKASKTESDAMVADPQPLPEEEKVVNLKRVAPVNKKPAMHKKRSIAKNLIAYHEPRSIEAEIFKSLRTNLLFATDKGQSIRSLLVTSPIPSDGKSFISSNLAISIAQGVEEHVLLVDGDIRKGTIHKNFGFGNVSGLSHCLRTGDNIAKVLLKTPIPKLTLLPAGRPPMNPTELLSSSKMKELLREVKNRYQDRYVIIDSPPPLMASETIAISKYVDGIILIVRAGKTSKESIEQTIEKIGREKIVGIVMNHSDQAVKKYYGYGKSYYYHEKRKKR